MCSFAEARTAGNAMRGGILIAQVKASVHDGGSTSAAAAASVSDSLVKKPKHKRCLCVKVCLAHQR